MGNYKNSLLPLAVLAFFATGLLSRCAQIGMPQGGPRDSLPPVIDTMIPKFGTTNFTGKRIFIGFNEYVQIKDQQKEFFTSPFMKKSPSLVLKGRGIQVDIQDTLLPDQTYSLNFGRSIADNNEGNPYTGLRYVFSTGAEIDSLVVSGYAVNAYTTDTLPGPFVFFFDPAADSIPGCDSTIYNSRALSVGRAFPNGIFLAENLKPMPYRIIGLDDQNGDRHYQPGVDRVAFLDSLCNPLEMPSFDVWYDTTRNYLQASPQMLLRFFMEPPVRRQTLSTSRRPSGNRVDLYFGAPHPQIQRLSFEGIDSARIQREYLTKGRDSLALWIDSTGLSLPDTLRGTLIYLKQDSVMNYAPDTVALKLFWKAPKVKETKKKVESGKEPEKLPNPFKVSVIPSGQVNPEQHIAFSFSVPLTQLDTAAILLEQLPEGEKNPGAAVPVSFTQDSVKIREWTLKAPWKPGSRYKLMIPAGTFHNANGEQNDTLNSEFGIHDPDKFATVVLNIKGQTPESQYTVELLSEQGQTLDEKRHLTTGKHIFRYIAPGKVRIRVIDDSNGNGVWDTGSILERRQPERAEIFVAPDGSDLLAAKENWELAYELDMAELFAPMTMERMEQIIARREAIRFKKLAEEKEAAIKRRKEQGHSHGGSSGGNRGGGGRSGSY